MNQRGTFLFEAILVLGLLCALCFPAHLAVLRQGRKDLDALERHRLSYDGQSFFLRWVEEKKP